MCARMCRSAAVTLTRNEWHRYTPHSSSLNYEWNAEKQRERMRDTEAKCLLYKVKGKIMWAVRALWLYYFKQTHTLQKLY